MTTGLALRSGADRAGDAGVVTKARFSAGSVDLDFSAAATAFDYLAVGETVTLTYTVAVDDIDGGMTTADLRGHRHRHQRRAGD